MLQLLANGLRRELFSEVLTFPSLALLLDGRHDSRALVRDRDPGRGLEGGEFGDLFELEEGRSDRDLAEFQDAVLEPRESSELSAHLMEQRDDGGGLVLVTPRL